MTRRRLIATGLGATAWLTLGCSSNERPSEGERVQTRPNLLLFVTDDQSWDEVGYASSGRVQTPHLDRLAREGTVFRNAYCAAIPCVTSRASLMSGLDFHRWSRDRSPTAKLAQGTWTWAHALRAAGYETVLVGKMHLTPRAGNHGFERMALCDPTPGAGGKRGRVVRDDYERWLDGRGALGEIAQDERSLRFPLTHPWPFDPDMHRISWVRDRAIEFLQVRPRQRPYALVVSFMAPHLPYDPAEPFASMYPWESIEVPDDHWEDLHDLPPSLARLTNVGFRRDLVTRPAFQKLLAAYRGLTSQVDDAIGAIAKHVELDETLLLFASDHGDFLGKRGRLVKSPPVPFEPLARIPMFACGAGVPAGATVDHPVSLVDVAPTFLAAAGTAVPGDLDGVALQPSLAAPDRDATRSVYCIGPGFFHMLRRGDVKYLRSEDGTEDLLFDLAADPGEVRDLARDTAWRTSRDDLASELDRVLAKPPSDLPSFPAHQPVHRFGGPRQA